MLMIFAKIAEHILVKMNSNKYNENRHPTLAVPQTLF